MSNYLDLPDDLPVPQDDRAADHLADMAMPSVVLEATDGSVVAVGALTGRTVIYASPMTGRPGHALPEGWDDIPGARGCTPQACAFRDHHAELQELGAEVFGLSTQSNAYQREAVERLHLPFAMLSDEKLDLTRALRLPTFEVDGATLLKRLTLIVRHGRIEHVFYPVFPPNTHAEDVCRWLEVNR